MDRIEVIRKNIEKCYDEALRRAKVSGDEYWDGKADAYRNVLVTIDLAKDFTVKFHSVIGEIYVHTTVDRCKQVLVDANGTPLFTRERTDVDSAWCDWKPVDNNKNDEQ